jgi:hypothetical protein
MMIWASQKKTEPESTEFLNFQELLDKLLTVPKEVMPSKPRKRKRKPKQPKSADNQQSWGLDFLYKVW